MIGKKKNEMAGRKKIVYTDEQKKLIDDLSKIGCTLEEISAIAQVPFRSLCRHFGKIKKDGFNTFKGSIRRQQYKLLANGNATMGVWLGKQYLNQRDNIDGVLTISAEEIAKTFSAVVSVSGTGSAT